MFRLSRLAIGGVFLTLCACQTPEHKLFAEVKPGMEKDQVLEVVGSPRSSRRWQGKDRWTYQFYQGSDRILKEVVFENGVATYVGAPIKASISADEQDRLNEESNLRAEREYQEGVRKARQESEDYFFGPGSTEPAEEVRTE